MGVNQVLFFNGLKISLFLTSLAHKLNYSVGTIFICSAQSHIAGGESVCKTGHREKEASCAACLRLFQVRASVPCGTTPSLLLCVRFLTVDTPTRAIWPAYELHHLPCTAVFWAKLVGR